MAIKIEYKKEKRPIKRIVFTNTTYAMGPDYHEPDIWWIDRDHLARCKFTLQDVRDLRDACNAILGEE